MMVKSSNHRWVVGKITGKILRTSRKQSKLVATPDCKQSADVFVMSMWYAVLQVFWQEVRRDP